MRVSREQANRNREAVIEAAGRLFREHGFTGVGIAEIMKAAGLTHGGFYGQFASKSQLEAEASRRALAEKQRLWRSRQAPSAAARAASIADFYLTAAHRDAPAEGCAMAALLADSARAGPEVQAEFRDGIEAYIALLEGEPAGDPVARDEAIATLSAMVGALALSRAVGAGALGDEILESVSRTLRAQSGEGQDHD